MKFLYYFTFIVLAVSNCFSQTDISGKIYDEQSKQPVSGITVIISGSSVTKSSVTDSEGIFKINLPSENDYTLTIDETENYKSYSEKIKVTSKNQLIEINLTPKTYKLNDVYVYGVTKNYERLVDAPAAVDVLYPETINEKARGNQIAGALSGMNGLDILKNGATDYIVNTRGFNGGLNRRILVLQDGRDVAMPLLGAVEWNSFSYPVDDYARIEFIRGPSASLYGANAFNGVLNMISYAPRDIQGGKISFVGGDYKTFRADARYAGLIGNKFSYKISLGRSQSLNFANRRDSLKYLEYPGLPLESKPLTSDDRNTYSNYGALRVDYDISASKKLKLEAGYSNNANETFVFGLGRTFVKNTERPYVLAGYNSDNVNINAYYMKRYCLDSMWLLVPRSANMLGAPLLDNDDDIMLDAQYKLNHFGRLQLIFGASQQFQNIQTYGTSIPNEVHANYTGLYGEAVYPFSQKLKFVGSLRFDRTNIHESQFSPRGAIVYSPIENHQFRVSVSRSFQRPNYSELYRLTPDAPAFKNGTQVPAFIGIDKVINDTLTALTGISYNIKTNLSGTRAYAVGNQNLAVEKNLGVEFGYKGEFFDRFYLTVDIYYNHLNDFITTFLPGVNKDITPWSPDLPAEIQQYTQLVKSIVYNQISPRDRARLSMFNGLPSFVVSNANVGSVNQYGLELGVNVLIARNLTFSGNYSHYEFNVEKNASDPDILSNTSPDKFNLALSYNKQGAYDASLSLTYSRKFDWLAGTYIGEVPTYTVVNFSAGYYIFKNLQAGVYVYNILNEKHYEIFGGTYMPRYATGRLSFTF